MEEPAPMPVPAAQALGKRIDWFLFPLGEEFKGANVLNPGCLSERGAQVHKCKEPTE